MFYYNYRIIGGFPENELHKMNVLIVVYRLDFLCHMSAQMVSEFHGYVGERK